MRQNHIEHLNVMQVRSYNDIEGMRTKLCRHGGRGGAGDFSRAELCRRAGMSDSTYYKGMKNKTRPMVSTLRFIRTVLEARRHELLLDMQSEVVTNE